MCIACRHGEHCFHLLEVSLAEDTTGHVALAEVVLDSPLPGGGALGESCGATKGTGKRLVLHADNADVGGATGCALASHTSRHLDLHLELCVCRERNALDA